MIEPVPLQQVDRTYVLFQGRKLSYFAGCDYFRMASHPAVLRAMQDGVKRYGLNVAASRLTTGNHALYQRLERQLARFFKAEAAVLISTGYMTNLAVAQAVAGRFSHALIDEKAHVCLRDAAQFLGCPVFSFKNCDPADVTRLVKRCGRGARIVLLTDGLYSGPGTVAPLVEYLKALPKQSLVLVDDAHGAGVVGPTGKGSPEFTGAERRRIVQTLTLSKAFGVYGGVVLCSRKLRQQIVDKSHCFVGSTPLPLPLANAALTAIRLHRNGMGLRRRLRRNVARVKAALCAAGVEVPAGPGAVVPIHPRTANQASALRQALLAAGIYPSFIKYPSGPAAGYFRFVISSEHTPAQLDNLSGVLGRVCGKPLARPGALR